MSPKKPESSRANPVQDLRRFASRENAQALARFFKTGPGQYGEGDRFLGVKMPELRLVARAHREIAAPAHAALLRSPFHEERMLALVIWSERSRRGEYPEQKRIARAFLENVDAANNWDLIDVNVPWILGPVLTAPERVFENKMRAFIRSPNLWRRRIALLSTFSLLRAGEFELLLEFCRAVIGDSEDLIHKASGWMLREAGKRDLTVLRTFLQEHAAEMPRTMLRYAIERLPASERKRLLATTRRPECR